MYNLVRPNSTYFLHPLTPLQTPIALNAVLRTFYTARTLSPFHHSKSGRFQVMKSVFGDYKTPSMTECEALGREIGLHKRVVQVWFQNARAKERKTRSATGTVVIASSIIKGLYMVGCWNTLINPSGM